MVRRRRNAFLRAAFAASLSIAVFASTATTASAQPAQVAHRAETLYKEGVALANAGNAEAALKKFEESYGVLPSGKASFQMGQMERTLGRYKAALHDFRQALQDPLLPVPERRAAEKATEDLKQEIGVITFDVPAGAIVTVDTVEVDPKMPLEVLPGAHEVRIHLGADSRSLKLTCPAGKVTVAKLRFEGPPDATQSPIEGPPKEERTRWPAAKTVTVATTAAAGVGLLATSAVLFLIANGADKAPSDGACNPGASPGTDCMKLREDRDTYDSQRSLSTAFFYSGLGLAAVAAVTTFLWPNQRVTIGVAPATRGTGGAGALTVRF